MLFNVLEIMHFVQIQNQNQNSPVNWKANVLFVNSLDLMHFIVEYAMSLTSNCVLYHKACRP